MEEFHRSTCPVQAFRRLLANCSCSCNAYQLLCSLLICIRLLCNMLICFNAAPEFLLVKLTKMGYSHFRRLHPPDEQAKFCGESCDTHGPIVAMRR